MFKLYQITQKAVKISKLASLITDTIKYFHDQGVSRGVFGNDLDVIAHRSEPLKQTVEND